MESNSELEGLVAQRIEQTAERRKEVLDTYAKGDWTNLAPVEQTVDHLEYIQQHDIALDYARKKQDWESRDLETVAPPGPPPAAIEDLGQLIFEKIVGKSEIMPIRFMHRGSQVARAIGRVVFRTQRQAVGTGFLVSPRLLLTNCHVLQERDDARNTLAQFEYLTNSDRSTTTPVEFQFQPDVLFLQSPIAELDCALVAVEPVNADGVELSRFGWCTLRGQTGKEHPGERVNIIHHPQGIPQQVSLRENFMVLILDNYLHYMTDTSPGSSGSPVFNDEWDVVALHHAGREIEDPEEVRLYRDSLGTNVPAGVDADATTVIVNEGARVSRIVEWLTGEATGLTGEARDLLDEALVDALETTKAGPEVAAKRRSTADAPVTVNVYVGGGASPTITTAGTVAAGSALELFKGETERSVLRGLGVLAQRRETAYLPPPPDRDDRRAEYYGDIPADVAADNLSPAELYDALNARISENGGLTIAPRFPDRLEALESFHRRTLEAAGLESTLMLEDAKYDRSRAHLYTWVDLHPDRMLHCIYTGTLIAPEQLLLKDLITGLDMADELPRRFRNNQFLNCEHVVPQSWFKHEPVARADLHHLFTSHGTANNFRSDSVYSNLAGEATAVAGPQNLPEYIEKAGLKAPGPKRFEPFTSKPVVARATLYFLVAHQGKIDESRIDQAQIDLLVEWSKQAPPNEYELHRNESIGEVQGNRNPLIDFPEWVDHIDFKKGLAPTG